MRVQRKIGTRQDPVRLQDSLPCFLEIKKKKNCYIAGVFPATARPSIGLGTREQGIVLELISGSSEFFYCQRELAKIIGKTEIIH